MITSHLTGRWKAARDQIGEVVREGPRWAFLLSLLPIIGIIGDIGVIVWAWRRRKAKAAQADAATRP
ncbi:MAG: hypothetical protein ACRD2W_13265 [Acidimicrobiales bacterium]